MRISLAILSTFVSSLALASGDSQTECDHFGSAELTDSSAPSFDGYPIPDEPAFTAAKLNLKSSPIARSFRTMIRLGMKDGPNFAGHYAAVTWGCGSSCTSFAVVDLRTGSVYTVPGIVSVSTVRLDDDGDFLKDGFRDVWALRFKLTSNLLVVIGTINEDDATQGAFYYEFSNNTFELKHKTVFLSKCKG